MQITHLMKWQDLYINQYNIDINRFEVGISGALQKKSDSYLRIRRNGTDSYNVSVNKNSYLLL